ncbi:ABC transporter substrate-binding protein [Galactobacter caseinivorans]|nr:ABC transporter substrate-binding protein [Galactobacter caseinivorans]
MQLPGTNLSRRAVLGGSLGALGVLLAGCTPAQPDPNNTGGNGGSGRLLSLQTPASSGSWDPVIGSDLESQRITRQVYDRLVGIDAQTGNPAPSLAESWTVSEDGLSYEFVLRQGITFSDDTPFNADAVVANVNRWKALGSVKEYDAAAISTLLDAVEDSKESTPTPTKQSPSPSPSQTPQSSGPSQEPTTQDDATTSRPEDAAGLPQVKGGDPLDNQLSDVETALISAAAPDERTVRLTLRRPITPLLRALTHPAFSIVSPQALKEADALRGLAKKDTLRRGAVGTGPFTAATDGETVVLTARHGHFSGEIAVDQIRLTPTPRVSRRVWDLEAQKSDGFDLVTVDVLKELVLSAVQVPPRDPFSVTYLGLNRSNKWLADDRVRRALAHAIDRNALLDLFLSSSKAASSPLAPSLGIEDPGTSYPFDPEKARRLLADAKYTGQKIPFLFPTDVARPYLPLPERLFSKLSGMLSTVGITVEPVAVKWDDGYFTAVRTGRHAGLHLLGIQGTYRDPENFLGPLFSRTTEQLDYDSPEVRRRLRVARALPEGESRQQAYADIVELLTVDLPLIPLVYPISSLALGPRILEYPVSPVLDEPLARVRLA